MNRRHFGLSVAAAVLLAQQLREAVAQSAGQPRSADTDAAWRMRDAAAAFLASLDEAARKAVSFPLEADQRTSWSNLPVALVPRVGVNIGALGVDSRRRLHDLLRASTSSQGYHKIAAIMRHDDILRAAELEYLQHNPPRPRAGRNAIESMGSANYWVAIFGEPVRGKAWAWLLTGHHLGATFTCADGRVTAAPLFLGAQPLEDLTGPYAGFAVLSHEGLRGLNLVGSLHPEQAKVAVVSTEPFFSDVLTGVGRRNSLSRFEGLPAGDLDAPQKQLLLALVEEYVRNADTDAVTDTADHGATSGRQGPGGPVGGERRSGRYRSGRRHDQRRLRESHRTHREGLSQPSRGDDHHDVRRRPPYPQPPAESYPASPAGAAALTRDSHAGNERPRAHQRHAGRSLR
jgi:hypothetical protein